MSHITVVKPVSSFCGKSFSLSDSGKIIKSARAAAPAKSVARTVPCESLETLSDVINGLVEGEAIILGYVPETVGVEQFHLWSVSQIERAFKEVGELIEEEPQANRSSWIIRDQGEIFLPRKKFLFNRAPFICIDRDVDEVAPENIKKIQELSNNDFLKIICQNLGKDVSRSFYGADFLPVSSSSSQVYTLDGTPYVTDPSAHLFFKVENPEDIDRFSAALFAQAMAHGYSYNKEINRKDNVNAYRKQTIFDPSVFTSGRLFFESSPKISNGLKIVKSPCQVFNWEGRPVRTEEVRDPNEETIEKLRSQNISFHRGKAGSHFSSEGLHPEMVIETQHGPMSVDMYERGDYGKIRCQTPFRESSSWAAYLNKHDDGEAYLWDEGSRTKYRLVKEDLELDALYKNAVAAVATGMKLVTLDEYEQLEEVEMVSGESYSSAGDDYEQDLLALVEFEEERNSGMSNVVPINDQFTVDQIEKPEERPLNFTIWDGHSLEAANLREPEDMFIWGEGALVKGGLTLFGGVPKVGKSDLLMNMLMAAACGSSFLGYQFDSAHKVLWFQAELMPEFLRARYKVAINNFSLPQQEMIKSNLIMTGNGKKQINGNDNQDYKKLIEKTGASIVAVDPLRNLVDIANESDASEMISALSSIKESALSVHRDISVIVVHHLRKVSKIMKDEPFDLFSGSGALRGYYDSGLVMMADDELVNHRHLHWEIRNGKPIDSMEVVNDEGNWSLNGGVIDSAMKATNAKIRTDEEVFKSLLLELLTADKNTSAEKAAHWPVVRTKLQHILFNRNIEFSDKTMSKYAHDTQGVRFKNRGRGQGSLVYLDR